jgi:hypothetical protein
MGRPVLEFGRFIGGKLQRIGHECIGREKIRRLTTLTDAVVEQLGQYSLRRIETDMLGVCDIRSHAIA